MQVLWGVRGIVALLAVALLLSNDRRAMNPRTVVGALLIRIAFAAIGLYSEVGNRVLEALTNGVQR